MRAKLPGYKPVQVAEEGELGSEVRELALADTMRKCREDSGCFEILDVEIGVCSSVEQPGID